MGRYCSEIHPHPHPNPPLEGEGKFLDAFKFVAFAPSISTLVGFPDSCLRALK